MENAADRLRRRLAGFEAKVNARLADIEREAEAIRVYLRMRALYEQPSQPGTKAASAPTAGVATPSALTPESPFYGKSNAEAAAVLVRQTGRPMTEVEIFDGLRAAGVPFVSINPVVNLRMAMRKRPDLLTSRGGRWERTTSVDIPPEPADTGCVPNRSREVHMAKTIEGLAASRARGVVGGRRPSLPADTPEKVRQMVAPAEQGGEGLSVTETAKRLGISKTTIYKMIPPRAEARRQQDQSPVTDLLSETEH